MNLQKNVDMLDVINKATSISCYFILSMYFLDNIRTFSTNIKFICTNFRNREKIVLLSRFFFLFWDECKKIKSYLYPCTSCMQQCSIYTQKAKTLVIVVEFPNRMSTTQSMLDKFVLLFDLHMTQIMYASSWHIRLTLYVPSHIDSLCIDCSIKPTQQARPTVPKSRPTQKPQGARK
jgi:hypothetical protein